MNERQGQSRVKAFPVLPMCPRCKSLEVRPVLYGRAGSRLKRLLGAALAGGRAAEAADEGTVYFCNHCNLSW